MKRSSQSRGTCFSPRDPRLLRPESPKRSHFEGTLFKRFGSKDHLFERAMLFPCLEATLNAIHHIEEDEDSVERELLDYPGPPGFLQGAYPRMMRFQGVSHPRPARHAERRQSPPRLLLREAEQGLNRENEKGEIHLSDPEVMLACSCPPCTISLFSTPWEFQH